MAFKQADIGPTYDLGLATRDGSTLSCIDENGNAKLLNQVAYMFAVQPGQEQLESADLVRKQQLTQLSTANIIDREFTLYPQATQGNWVGGEGQRIFTDPSMYYQGRGLIWPSGSFVPVMPLLSGDIDAYQNNLGNTFTQVNNVLGMSAGGQGGGVIGSTRGVVHGFQGVSAAGTLWYIVFTATDSASTTTGNGVLPTPGNAQPLSATIVNGTIYFMVNGDANIYSTTYNGTVALTAVATFATLPVAGTGAAILASGYVGKDWILIAYSSAVSGSVRVFLSAAGTFADVALPQVQQVTSMAINGSTLYIAASDKAQGYLLAYDIVGQQVSTLVQFPGIRAFKIGVVQGSVFILATNRIGAVDSNSYLSIECYLYTGSLQFITRLNPAIMGLPPNLSYLMPVSVSTIAVFGQYAFFAIGFPSSPLTAMVMAYDVVRGTLFTAVDQFNLSATLASGVSILDLAVGLVALSGGDTNQRPLAPIEGRVAGAGTLPAGSYTVVITWVGTAGQESLASAGTSQTLILNDALLSRAPSLAQSPAGALAVNYYLTAAPGGVTLGFIGQSGLGGTNTLTNPATGNGVAAPTISTFGTTGDFTLYASEFNNNVQVSPVQTMHWMTFGTTLNAMPILAAGGRIISSVIDFTSASVKLYRQIVATHEPIPTGGQFSLYAYMDLDGDNLPADTTLKTTNSTVGATTTTLLINRQGKKLVYIADWPTRTAATGNIAPHPISVAIQAATGWVWKSILSCTNSARLNNQQPNTFCFSQQGLDAKAAYNFVRQLWRQKGGQCLVSLPNGDQFNAVIESEDFHSPKPNAVTMSGDRKTHYEVILSITIREDL